MHAYTKAWRAMSDMGFGPGPDGKWIQLPVEKSEPSASDVHVDKPVGKQPTPAQGGGPGDPAAPPASTAPPGLGPSKGVPRCGNCTHFDPAGHCIQYNNYPVNAGMVCGTWAGVASTKFIPPAEVQAAAKAALASDEILDGVDPALLCALAKGEGIAEDDVRKIATHFERAATEPVSSRNAWGGAHAAKWAARVLKKLEAPAPVVEKAEVEFELAGEIVKVDAAQHLVFGWASVVEIAGRPIVDTQSDIILPATLEDAAYAYVESSGKAGEMHEGKGVTKIGQLVESMLFTPEKVTAMLQSLTSQGINAVMDMPFVGWWIGFRIDSPEVWDAITSDPPRLKAFSVGGKGKRAAC